MGHTSCVRAQGVAAIPPRSSAGVKQVILPEQFLGDWYTKSFIVYEYMNIMYVYTYIYTVYRW